MLKYGLRIGEVGIEFPSKDDRDKAIKAFTSGTDVMISESGIKYRTGKGNFSVYDRDTKDEITICRECNWDFFIATCFKRVYPYKNSWDKIYLETENYICADCYAQAVKAKEVFEAKKLIEEG
jgi:hypothetical protein